jgi:gas vesicle protein
MNRLLCYSGGLLLGAAVGVGLVVLFAPQSGADTRQMIRDRVNEILQEGRMAAEARREELMAQFEVLRQPTRSGY